MKKILIFILLSACSSQEIRDAIAEEKSFYKDLLTAEAENVRLEARKVVAQEITRLRKRLRNEIAQHIKRSATKDNSVEEAMKSGEKAAKKAMETLDAVPGITPQFYLSEMDMFLKKHPKMKDADEALQKIIQKADASGFDFKVVEVFRTSERQKELYKKGATKTLNSAHNNYPSLAVDMYIKASGKIDWKNTKGFAFFAGFLIGVSEYLKNTGQLPSNLTLIWGGSWSGDKDVSTNRFEDLGHYEVRYEKTSGE